MKSSHFVGKGARKVMLLLALLLLLQLALFGGAEAAPAEASGVYHTVRYGETLSSIAVWYGTTVQAIMNANYIVNPNLIYAGTVLFIPAGYGYTPVYQPVAYCRLYHTVTYGDTMLRLGSWYGVSPFAIAERNGIYNLNLIYRGQSLCIP
jgi:spore germination protein